MNSRRLESRTKGILVLALGTGLLFSLAILPSVKASSSWNLSVDLRQSTFGTERVCAKVKGPFGHEETQCTPTGPSASVSFNIPGSAVPSGYQYQVCTWGGVVSAILQNCQMFTHGSGDESIWMTVGG